MNSDNEPNPITTILAVTDFSDGASRGVDRAARIAHQLGADLHIAHAALLPTVIPAWGDPGGGAWVDADAIVAAAYEALEAVADRVEAQCGDRPKPHVTSGTAYRGLADLASSIRADLVVVGAQGRGFKLGRLLGSTAERLLRRLTIPVLVVRNAVEDDYRRLVTATDFSGPALAVARTAHLVARNAEHQLVHVHEDLYAQLAAYAGTGEENRTENERKAGAQALATLEQEVARLGNSGINVTGVIRDGQASEVLPVYVQECSADLLALGAHGRGGLERLLLGSVSSWLVAHVKCDVLVGRGED